LIKRMVRMTYGAKHVTYTIFPVLFRPFQAEK
jgi:hypothetical protein